MKNPRISLLRPVETLAEVAHGQEGRGVDGLVLAQDSRNHDEPDDRDRDRDEDQSG